MNARATWVQLGALVLLLVIVFVAKRESLVEPHYWDALGYVVPQALDMLDNDFRITPPSSLGHPPLFFLALAVLFRVFGASLPVAHALPLVLAAVALFATFRIGERLYGAAVGVAAAILLFSNQIFFAQIGTLNVTTAICALGALSTHAYLAGKRAAYVIAASALILLHQAAVLFVVAFAVHAILGSLSNRERLRRAALRLAIVCIPLLPLVAWLVHHQLAFGWVFKQELLHNRSAFWQTLATNVWRQFFFDPTRDNVNRFNWLLTPLILAAVARAWWIRRRGLRPAAMPRDTHAPDAAAGKPELLFVLLCAAPLAAFSYSDDLPRYFQPMLPYYYLGVARSMAVLMPEWRFRSASIPALGAVFGLVFTLNYRGTRAGAGWQLESNLEYRDVIATHLAASRYLAQYPGAIIVTCWPMLAELGEPRFGYVDAPLRVSADTGGAPRGALIYTSPQSACRGQREYAELVARARLLREFEQNQKRARVYLLD